jgi:hypothetical protein
MLAGEQENVKFNKENYSDENKMRLKMATLLGKFFILTFLLHHTSSTHTHKLL